VQLQDLGLALRDRLVPLLQLDLYGRHRNNVDVQKRSCELLDVCWCQHCFLPKLATVPSLHTTVVGVTAELGAHARSSMPHLEGPDSFLVLLAAGLLGFCPLLYNVQLLCQLRHLLLQVVRLLAC
jgi:hypothetical protein